jgi:hypothetical protein
MQGAASLGEDAIEVVDGWKVPVDNGLAGCTADSNW